MSTLSKFRRPAAALALIAANGAGIIATIINFKLLVSLLPTETMGRYALVTTYQSMAILVVLGPLRIGIVRLFAAERSIGLSKRFLQFLTRTFGLASFATMAGAIFIAQILSSRFYVHISEVAACVAFAIATAVNEILVGFSLNEGRVAQAAFRSLIGRLALTSSIAICWSIHGLTISSLFAMATLIVVLPSLVSWRTAAKHWNSPQGGDAMEWSSTILVFFWVVAFTGILSTLQLALPRYILSARANNEELARFYVATQVANLAMVAWAGTVGQAVSPHLFSRYRRGDPFPFPFSRHTLVGMATVMAAAILAAIIFLLFGDAIIGIALKQAYVGISPLVAASFFVYGIYGMAQIVRIFGDQIHSPKIFLPVNIFYPFAVVALLLLNHHVSPWYILGAMAVGEVIHLSMVVFISLKTYRKGSAQVAPI